MEFGRVSDPQQVDCSLPADPPENGKVLPGTPSSAFRLYVGLTGWSEPAWRGDLYPANTRPSDMLRAYAASFSSVELNSTFYGIPRSTTLRRWVSEVGEGFSFCPKVPQIISHAAAPGLQQDALENFRFSLTGFGDTLGETFLQLPPRFGLDRLEALISFCEVWPHEIPLSIELRNEELLHSEAALACIRKAGMGLVITDTAGHRELVHMRLLQKRVLIRFVAVGESNQDDLRLVEWIQRLKTWHTSGIEQVYFFCHEPDNRYAPGLSRRFLDRVRRDAPEIALFLHEVKHYGQQQPELFPRT